MASFETPGVYFQRADADGGGVAALRTDVAGFVGLARRGPLHLAVPIESFRQFESWFGGVFDNGYLAYCARAFFENGGRRIWVVRTAGASASTATYTVADANGPAWRIEAASPGVGGNDLALRLAEVRRVQRRGSVSANEPRRLVVDSIAGTGVASPLQLWQGPVVVGRATVREVDAVVGTVTLDRELAALTPGVALRVESVAYSLEVFELGRLLAVFDDLSLVPEHPRYGPALLCQPWQIIDRREPEAAPAAPTSEIAAQYFRAGRGRGSAPPPPVVIRELRSAPSRELLEPLVVAPRALPPLTGGADGLSSLGVEEFIGLPSAPDDSDALQAAARLGLRALERVDDIGVLAIPDIHIQPRQPLEYAPPPACAVDKCLPPPVDMPAPRPAAVPGDMPPRFELDAVYRVQSALIAHCEARRDRVALLDAPFDACRDSSLLASELRAWRRRFDSRFAALYAPWIDVVDPLAARPGAPRTAKLTRPIPPSGHMAGVIAANDFRRGVHAAPANIALNWAQAVSLDIDHSRHGLLNELGVNVVRAEPGRGLRPMGARTVSSDPDWRYLNVRRLMCMIAKAIDASIQWAVFEPNDWRTRTRLALVIGSFLQELWNRGAFAGDTPEQGYFIRCTDANNPPDARARGELVIDIGVAPTVPFEFIVLRVGRDANGFTVGDGAARDAAA
jgi:hypothetical protein